MIKSENIKSIIQILVIVVAMLSIVILGGLASSNPDGFEWALFEFANFPEPSNTFAGIWAFLGEGPIVEAITGVIGVLFVLTLGTLFFKALARKSL